MIHGKSISHQAVVGMGAVLSIWSEVGDEGAIVAEGAAVKLRQVLLPRTVAAGNPARTVRAVTAEDEAFWQWGKQRYLDLAKKYLSEGMQPIVP